jgi:hypothetical protein
MSPVAKGIEIQPRASGADQILARSKNRGAELEVIQPERCIIDLQSPQRDVNAKYFGGNRLRICCCGRSCTR